MSLIVMSTLMLPGRTFFNVISAFNSSDNFWANDANFSSEDNSFNRLFSVVTRTLSVSGTVAVVMEKVRDRQIPVI